MDGLIQQLRDLLETPIITLDDPVKVVQMVVLIGILAVSLLFAGLLRLWFRRLFSRLKISQSLEGRLLAFLFLIIIVVGGTLAFRFAGISTGVLGKLFNYPLIDLFKPATPEGENISEHNLTLASVFYAFVIVFGMFILSKYFAMAAAARSLTSLSNCGTYAIHFAPLFSLYPYHHRCHY